LAYSLGETIVRGGYGISFGRIFPATFQWARFNPPEMVRVNVQSPDLFNPLKGYDAASGTPRSGLNILDPNLVPPYSQHYSLEVDRDLPLGFQLAVSYTGSRTLKLFQYDAQNRAQAVAGIPLTTATIDDRRPDPRYFGISHVTNMGRSYFDAGQLAVQKTTRNNLALRATYIWSKAIDTGTDFSTTATTNREDQRSQTPDRVIQDLKALSRFDTPHAFVLIESYPLPGRWLRGFTLSGSVVFRSGTPFTVETGSDSPPWGNVDGERQDRPSILDPSLIGRSIDHPDTSTTILRRSAFSTEDLASKGYGNLARNTFRKDGSSNFNMALQREFAVKNDASRTLLMRVEAINLMNHAQFKEPNSQLSSPSFGQITDTLNAGRIIQFSSRLKF